jgi:hypothetical protein
MLNKLPKFLIGLEDLWLFTWKLPSDLFNFLLDLQRSLLNNEILLVLDRFLVFGDPLPKLLILQPLLGLEFAEIGDDGSEDL